MFPGPMFETAGSRPPAGRDRDKTLFTNNLHGSVTFTEPRRKSMTAIALATEQAPRPARLPCIGCGSVRNITPRAATTRPLAAFQCGLVAAAADPQARHRRRSRNFTPISATPG